MRRMMCLLAVVLVVGCDVGDALDEAREGNRRGPATQLGGQLAPAIDTSDPKPPAKPPAEPPAEPSAEPSAVAEEPAPEPPVVVREEAKAGVSGKGQGYGRGPVATPVAAYFGTRERIIFQIQIPSAMNIFKGMEGRNPKSHKEFMAKIIKANSIILPELANPETEQYVYDPETGKLMVERSE